MTELREELEQVPATRGAALRVVQRVDDPSAGAAEVAQALALDPALTARILQVANSAYYGLSGRIRTTSFAVTVVGFQTVRSLAALAAAGIGKDEALANLLDGVRDQGSAKALEAAGVRDHELPVLMSQVEEARDQLAAVLAG